MTTATIYTVLFYSLHLSNTLSKVNYPASVCVIGDVQADYNQDRDPRILMGTYNKMDLDQQGIVLDDDIVNTSAPIYEHLNFGDTGESAKEQYLFKLYNLHEDNGWVLTETLPVKGSSIKVFLTCFQDSLFDCIFDKWYWGYNSYEFPIKPLRILGGDCAAGMCLRNLTIQLKPDNEINKNNPSAGDYSKLDGEFYRIWDNETDRYQWINQRDPQMRWYYRHNTGPKETYNWVYSENTGDRIACAPGYVEMPLFCNTFVYAGSEGGENGIPYVTYNPDLPRDILGIPDWAAATNQIATSFAIGVCGVTSNPTVEPTLEPTAGPTIEPTPDPTPTPRCPKEYIFKATDQDTQVDLPCPFGWKGTSISRYCNTEAMWVHVEDDCFLISLTDDFSYFRDELWQSSTGFEGSVAADTFDSSVVPYLQSFPSFSGPLRLEFSMEINASYCGGFVLQFVDEVYNTTDGDLKASYDCTGTALIFEDEIATQAAIAPNSNVINGYILYRTETELFLQPSATVLFSAFSSAQLLNVTIENGSYLDAQQLYFGILDNATSQFITLHSLSITSFVDWFTVQENIWTTFPSIHFFDTYTSAGTGFPALDPVATHSFIEFRHPHYLQANGNSFEFRAPFTIRFIYGFRSFKPDHNVNNTNNGTSQFMLSLSTTTTKSDLFVPNEEIYTKVDLDFVFLDESVWINSETADSEVMNKTLCDDELFVEIHISVGNVTVTVYNDDGSECGDISLINTADIDASSLQFNLLKIAPVTDSFVSLSYIDVTAGVEADINTASPTHSPTMAPTVLCAYDGDNVTLNATVFGACAFGYYGPGDVGRCLPNGEIGNWADGCFQISFSDYFYDFDDDIWQVYTTEGVRGEATIALDGSDSLRFVPDDVALVGVIRSKQRINWPMRIRTVVEKRENECNLWAVGLGAEWDSRSPFSARTNWACQGGDKSKQMSLYNHTFRLYDSKCWNDAVDDSMEVVFSIRDGGPSHGAVVTTSTADCASLKLQIHDILAQSPWEDAYLWFGSYGESEDQDLKDKINQTIVGRFHSMQYTQFYSDFDGLMTHIWDANLSTVTEADNALLLAPGDVVIANDELFQFTIPFVIKVGLYRPERGDGDDWSKGEYAHFVSIGGRMDGYVEGMQSGVVQIVWDGKKKVRLIYSGDNIYETGVQKKTASGEDYCNWNEYGTQDVMIYVDSGKITIIDELCNDFNMTAAHDLNRTTDGDVNNISLGFIRPDKYNSGYRIGFKYIEAYQLPVAYGGQIANENAESAVVVDILDIYPYAVADDTILGLQIWLFILIVCGVVLICCIMYFVVAWKRKIFPFKEKISHESNMNMNAHKVPQSVDESNQSINARANAESAGIGGNVNTGLNTKSNLAQKLIPETSVDDPNGNANANANAFAASNNFNGYQMQQQQQQNLRQQQMQQQQQQFSGMDPQSLQYQMYQQQLFYQQQFMQMMMTNPQQQAILMNMNPIQRKQYIQSQMMIYMSRIAAMQQQNMIPIQQMQAQFRESNPGGGGEGGGTEGTGMSTGAFIEGGMGTNAAMNMGYGQQPQMGYGGQQQQPQQMGYGGPQQQQQQMGGYGGYNPPPQQVEMQPIKQNNVDILSEFLNRVPVETFYQMCPIGQDGYARTDENRARLMIAKFRGISPTDVAETDDAIAYFVNLSIDELKQQLAMLPEPIYELLKGPNYNDNDNYGDIQGVADFLVEFCEKVNLKQIFGQLESNLSMKEPGLDLHHARIVIANLRDATFGQVSENDPGVRLILNKTMVEMRFYLSNLPMSDLRLCDLKSYHRYAKSGNYKKGAAAANASVNADVNSNNQGGGGGGQQGFVFPTINLNYNGDIRQFMPPKFGCFDEIMGFIMNAWPHLNSFKLMFQDDQASWIRITTNIDVQECIKYAVEHKASYLSINIVG